MKRSPSLDFLRGAAAFAVAIPHYLTTNAAFEPVADAVAVAGVEIFFVLSGFVLAPQIVDWVVGRPWRNLGVFLARRWMRTIPPYVVALVVVALMTGTLVSADFLRYLFYVENLAWAANRVDFYPVAWSLAVEEWFYLLFAPLLFVVARLAGRGDRRLEAGFAILFILLIAVLRAILAPHDWDLNVRRVTLFRIDSIVWGYLLYLALEKRSFGLRGEFGIKQSLSCLGALALAAAGLELWIAARAVGGSQPAQQAFPYSSAAFGMVWVGLFWAANPLFAGRRVSALSFSLGRISYSAYLFHIMIVMALKPRVSAWPIAAQLALYLALLAGFSMLFWRGFERPVLAARPEYAKGRIDASSRAAFASASGRPPNALPARLPNEVRSPRHGTALAVALGLALLLGAVLVRSAFMANKPYLFYPGFVLFSILAIALVEIAGLAASVFGTLARAVFLFALVLPPADALYRSATGVPIAGSVAAPTYSYRAARENPAAFAMWWFYYLNEWIRRDGIRGTIEKPDPEKRLPFVLVPGSSGRMFDATIRINAAGFRGPELAAEKGDRFRIVALGESQTFGPTLRDGERPWPEQLQMLFAEHASCGRPVEVVNAGAEGYTLEDNLERLRRDILRLKPDLIVSAHGLNGLMALGLRQQAEPTEPGLRPRASALIGKAVYSVERALHEWRMRRIAPVPAPPPLSDDALLKSRYAAAYRQLIALARQNGVAVALATSSLAVDQSSPREVKDFYGAVFKPIDDIIAANAAHNRMLRLLAEEQGVPLIDATPGVDGVWDEDLFLDIVHFTERGNARTAELMFRRLAPILAQYGLRCVED